MNRQKDDRKIKKGEVINDDKTELTEEALEQVNGGAFALKKETQSVSRPGRSKIWLTDYNFPTPTTGD